MATTQEILDQLNAYETTRPDHGEREAGKAPDVWQDVILKLDEYNEPGTDAIDTGQSDRFALADGTVIAWDQQRKCWS